MQTPKTEGRTIRAPHAADAGWLAQVPRRGCGLLSAAWPGRTCRELSGGCGSAHWPALQVNPLWAGLERGRVTISCLCESH